MPEEGLHNAAQTGDSVEYVAEETV